ncbi:hypothetical protein MBEHAL_0803 [Halarchaeum acidiphilum MH1-52-1]|uniref:Uncharacterized protein n=1 Tax=Halarchaeum acidiphilum MH1-52-1 TaxID=1261545 RepID=U3ABA0_9EURY|nr:hypothetical protein MBEHAL_0803 [Halarchaeum acidiphilum MH1-52-1]
MPSVVLLEIVTTCVLARSTGYRLREVGVRSRESFDGSQQVRPFVTPGVGERFEEQINHVLSYLNVGLK